MEPVRIDNFMGGLNTTGSSGTIKDNQLSIAKNVYYNSNKQIETRRGFRTFGPLIGNSPITSYFFFQKDDGTGQMAVCSSGTSMYAYDGSAWNSIKTNLHEYEILTGYTTHRTRRDYAVYKNVIYMCNGVDQYASYNGTTYSQGTTTPVTCTFDNTTDIVIKAGHGLVANTEIAFTTTGSLPTGLSINDVYFVINPTANNFQVSLTRSGSAVNFTTDGTGTNNYYVIPTPRIRYVSQLTDRLFGSGDDGNPTTLYYSGALPADGFSVDANLVVVGGDENGRINAIGELGNIILALKANKVYSVDVANQSALPIDAQGGGYSDRSLANVGNSIVFFNESGIDTLKQRNGATGSQALESKPLSDDIRSLISQIEEKNYNGSTSIYIKKYNNYYFAFDASGDDIPDTVLVYNSLVGAWTQYTLPNIYDFGYYINSDGEYQFLFASGTHGRMYEFEYGYDDDGIDIEYEVQTKSFDFDTPGFYKTFEYVDVIGKISMGTEINASVIVDDDTVSLGTITQDNANIDAIPSSLGVRPIGVDSLTGPQSSDDIQLYPFSVRLPLFDSGSEIAVNLSSTGGQRILERMRIGVHGEPIDVFNYGNIL